VFESLGEEMTRRTALNALSLVSQAFGSLARPLLYRDVHVRSPQQLQKVSNTIETDKSLKPISLDADHGPFDDEEREEGEIEQEWKRAINRFLRVSGAVSSVKFGGSYSPRLLLVSLEWFEAGKGALFALFPFPPLCR
jgi:hypothetical protein